MRSNGPSGHPLDLVRSALDVAELLVQHVIRPAQQQAHPPDFTKEVGEVAMLLRLADRVLVREADQGRIAVLAWRISRIARSRSTRTVVAARPSRAATHVLAHGCLHQLGCRDDSFDELARAALASTASNASERVPFRLLDVAWVRHLLLGDDELDHPALELSPVGVGVDLVGTNVEDAYAFSHALRYATDFGRRALPASVDTAWLSEVTDALVLKALHEDDLDLLGELLTAPALLRRDWTPVQWFGWRVLCDTWVRYGFVPGPELPPPVEGEDAVETVRRVLGSGYHTTLVAGLAVATLVSTGHLPASTPPAGPTCEASVRRPGGRLPRLAAHLARALPRRAAGARRRTRRDRPAPRGRRHRRRRDRGVAERPVGQSPARAAGHPGRRAGQPAGPAGGARGRDHSTIRPVRRPTAHGACGQDGGRAKELPT